MTVDETVQRLSKRLEGIEGRARKELSKMGKCCVAGCDQYPGSAYLMPGPIPVCPEHLVQWIQDERAQALADAKDEAETRRVFWLERATVPLSVMDEMHCLESLLVARKADSEAYAEMRKFRNRWLVDEEFRAHGFPVVDW